MSPRCAFDTWDLESINSADGAVKGSSRLVDAGLRLFIVASSSWEPVRIRCFHVQGESREHGPSSFPNPEIVPKLRKLRQ